jgi:hypothetical protein
MTIVFVYNADSGVFNTLTDIAHKIFSPESYECNLCAITYGNFSMRGEWKEFLDSLDADFEFLHRNELVEQYGMANESLPAVYLKENGLLKLWISSEQLNACHEVADLKELINGKLS